MFTGAGKRIIFFIFIFDPNFLFSEARMNVLDIALYVREKFPE